MVRMAVFDLLRSAKIDFTKNHSGSTGGPIQKLTEIDKEIRFCDVNLERVLEPRPIFREKKAWFDRGSNSDLLGVV